MTEINNNYIGELYYENDNDDIWTTTDGRKIPIKNLEDNHLLNILRLYSKQLQLSLDLRAREYINDPYPQGEMAQLAFDSEFDNLLDMDWTDIAPPICQKLIEEAENRGLTIENLIKEYYQHD